MKNRLFKHTALLLALWVVLAALAGCGKAPAQDAPPQEPVDYAGRPALWEVTDTASGASLYLFGSIHAAEEALYPMEEAIMAAFERSDALAVEVDLLAYTEDAAKAMEMAAYLVYTDGRTITDEIDAETLKAAQDLLIAEGMDIGMPMEYTVMFRPYMFVSLLTGLSIEKADLSAEAGVDMHLIGLAREREMAVLEVESMDSQMQLLTGFPPEIQNYLLRSALDIEASATGVRALYEAWKVGDMTLLEALGATDMEGLDEAEQLLVAQYNKAMITDRNALMADVAEAYLKGDQKVFYVVGAMHMVGEDGIVQLLTDRGYDVKRV